MTLNKPSWNPPNWLFAPVWTLLYIMMAIAAWLVWKTGQDTKPAMVLFFSQLALNFAWSFLFFGARSPGLGLIGVRQRAMHLGGTFNLQTAPGMGTTFSVEFPVPFSSASSDDALAESGELASTEAG